METNNNQLNMDKVQEAMSTVGSTASVQGGKMTMLQSHKKAIILICFLVVVLGILTYFFKDQIFKNFGNNVPETYQEAIDQSFKEGYKTDYAYEETDITRTSIEMQKASDALSKKKPPTEAKKKALVDRINN